MKENVEQLQHPLFFYWSIPYRATKNSSNNFFFFVTYYFVHGSSTESAFSKRLNKTKQPVIIIARPFDTLLPKNAKFMVIMEQTSQKKTKNALDL